MMKADAALAWKGWLLAARPKTLSAAVVPIAVAGGVSLFISGQANPLILTSALLFALAIQVGTNFVNDALDFEKGADNEDRLGPMRVTGSGLFSSKQVMQAAGVAFLLALLFALPLIFYGGVAIVAIVLLSIACGYLYTGGPYPLAYVGLGELFVLLFFGFVSTVATSYLLTGKMLWQAFVAGGQVGALATVLIAINNMRDVKGDAVANKRTLAVRFGTTFARIEIIVLLATAYALSPLWLVAKAPFAALLPFLTLPLAVKIGFSVWRVEPSAAYNVFLAFSGLLQLIFGLLLTVGLVMAR